MLAAHHTKNARKASGTREIGILKKILGGRTSRTFGWKGEQ